MHAGDDDCVQATIGKSAHAQESNEIVSLRSIAGWLDEAGIDVIDVLKVDTEGCELPILQNIKDRLPAIRLIHLEYHSESDRREIDRLLEGTHALADGQFSTCTAVSSPTSRRSFRLGGRVSPRGDCR